MKINILLIPGVLLIIVGAIMKIFHAGESYGEIIYVSGFVLGAAYLFMRSRAMQKSRRK